MVFWMRSLHQAELSIRTDWAEGPGQASFEFIAFRTVHLLQMQRAEPVGPARMHRHRRRRSGRSPALPYPPHR